MKKLPYLITLLVLTSCTILTREAIYWDADIDDYKVFPTYDFKENNKKYSFCPKKVNLLDTMLFKNAKGEKETLDELLKGTKTSQFIVIQNDTILYEGNFNGYKRSDYTTLFSISKSVTSLLVGIAIDEGLIESVNDTITKYVPELRNKAPEFNELTIKQLLNMQAGLDFNENYSSPLSDMARLYYGTNQLGKLKRMKFAHKPGTYHTYQSAQTALLGIVVEKVTGKNLGEYFEEKVWKPLQMENKGSWSLDDKRHRSAKSYCGLNLSAIDLAKIGRLYLNKGKFKDQQIVSENWIDATLTNYPKNNNYNYQWYNGFIAGTDEEGIPYFTDSLQALKRYENVYANKRYNTSYYIFKSCIKDWTNKKYIKYCQKHYNWTDINECRWELSVLTGRFQTLGIMHQILYIDPIKNIIIVRLGETDYSNYKHGRYENLMEEIMNALPPND
ncbi:serine hydrolase domain-containing protein [Balneicella halophila]|nr:serine hydrolase [Balneicella halophila]